MEVCIIAYSKCIFHTNDNSVLNTHHMQAVSQRFILEELELTIVIPMCFFPTEQTCTWVPGESWFNLLFAPAPNARVE